MMASDPAPRASQRWLRPTLTIVLCAIVAALILSGRQWFFRHVHPGIQKQVNDLAAALKGTGLTVGEVRLADNMEGVEQVVVVDINGHPIRLLELDLSKAPAAKEIEHIRKNHSTTIQGAEQPAEVEGAIVILDVDKHPDKEKILDAFHKKAP